MEGYGDVIARRPSLMCGWVRCGRVGFLDLASTGAVVRLFAACVFVCARACVVCVLRVVILFCVPGCRVPVANGWNQPQLSPVLF